MITRLQQLIRATRLAKKSVIVTSLLLAAPLVPFLIPQSANADSDRQEGSEGVGNPAALEGTWIVQETLDSNSVPPGTLLNFTSIETYSAGGGFVATNNGPAAGGPPVQGNWVALGHRQFATTGLRLGFTPANVFTGLNKIRTQITLSNSGDEFTGTVQADIYLPNGTLLPIHPAGTFHGTRVPIEPLN
jgi:hypothetical protein